MKKLLSKAIVITTTIAAFPAMAQGSDRRLTSGVPWWDQNGVAVNAHGCNVIADDGRWYMFGEWKSDTTNAFTGFACYSSTNLVDWTFERVALGVQAAGRLGPNTVGERFGSDSTAITVKEISLLGSK